MTLPGELSVAMDRALVAEARVKELEAALRLAHVAAAGQVILLDAALKDPRTREVPASLAHWTYVRDQLYAVLRRGRP